MRGIQLRERPPRPNHQVMCKEKWNRILISGGWQRTQSWINPKEKAKVMTFVRPKQNCYNPHCILGLHRTTYYTELYTYYTELPTTAKR